MADSTEAWCRDVYHNKREKRLLVVTGPFGSGKTMALKGASRFVQNIYMDVWPKHWQHPITQLVVAWPKFASDIERGKNSEFYEDVCHAHVVFLDDIGAESDRFRSGVASELLGNLLSDLESRFVMTTTNVEPEHWREKWGGRVEDRLRRHASLCNLWMPHLKAKSYTVPV